MLRLDASTKSVTPLEQQAELRPQSFFDRHLLSDYLAQAPRVVFAEAGLELLALSGGELPFAVDPDGRLYVIAAQQGGRRPDLAVALEHASRIAALSVADILARTDLVDRDELAAFLRVSLRELNRTQGVVLVADSFDASALQTIVWLQSRYGLLVSCIALTLLADPQSGREFLQAQVSTPDTIQDAPERWLLLGAATESVATPPPVAAPVLPREEAPEWRRDFDAVFEGEVDDDELGSFPTVALPPPSEDPTTSESMGALFDEPEPADDTPLTANEDERRTAPRSPDYHARRLRLDYQGRLLGARLVDFSTVGLGVEVLSPLPIGSEVAVSGEVSGEDGVFSISGSVTVSHCFSRQDGVCRIGFSVENATLEKLSSPPEDFDRR